METGNVAPFSGAYFAIGHRLSGAAPLTARHTARVPLLLGSPAGLYHTRRMAKRSAVRGGGAELTVAADSPLGKGVIAAARILEGNFLARQVQAMMAAYGAHAEIGNALPAKKARIFYSALLPCRRSLIASLAQGYQRYFKLALAHAALKGDPAALAAVWLEPAIAAGAAELRGGPFRRAMGRTKARGPPL